MAENKRETEEREITTDIKQTSTRVVNRVFNNAAMLQPKKVWYVLYSTVLMEGGEMVHAINPTDEVYTHIVLVVLLIGKKVKEWGERERRWANR